ncbi:MAG: hypothetical protein PHN63_00365, partial [Candidatus Omnitrophica bacterium]|nr:hypothetical protein [Candidatus Omnitrophota bacterium]
MLKLKGLLVAVFLISFIACAVNARAEDNKWTRLVDESGKVLAEVQDMPDQGIPEDLLAKCQAVAV